MASLYETFPAGEARRIVKRLEFHHSPKHDGWPNMAEIEFSVLTRDCLQGRLCDPTQRRTGYHQLEFQHPRCPLQTPSPPSHAIPKLIRY